ncbi:MAG TPA: DMT family transporter [Burkholderiaceae bacterium]|nr:DMT family transporter [Burkholderiaceae bacterium]
MQSEVQSKPQPNQQSVFAAGLALAIGGSVLFSAKAVVIKLAYRYGVDATTLIALRMAFSLPFFVAALIWSSRGAQPLSQTDHARLIFIGLLGYYAASYLDFLGLQYVTAALERLILYLSPTLVVVLSALFLRKRFGRYEWGALALCYGGILLVFWHDVSLEGGQVLLGSAFVFAGAVCYAIYLIVSGELVQRLGAIRLTAYAMCVSSFAVFVQFAVLNPVSTLRQAPAVYWLSLLNAILCTVLPVFATMLAVERIGASRASMASMVGPVSTIALAYLFLDERISIWQVAGTALVLTGIYVLTRAGKVPAPKEEAT